MTSFDLFNPYPERKSFHDTINCTPEELAGNEVKAKAQELVVKEFFEARKGQKFTAKEVWKILIGRKLIQEKVPVDSIKRCCSNLKNKEILEKSDQYTIGEYGMRNYYYQLNEKKNENKQ